MATKAKQKKRTTALTTKTGKKSRAAKAIENRAAYEEVKLTEAGALKKRELEELDYLTKSYTGHYTYELAEAICNEVANGTSLKAICRVEGMPARSAVMGWMRDHEEFEILYTRAKEWSTEAMADDIMEIADNSSNDFIPDNYMQGHTPGFRVDSEHINRSRLRVETRKYLMAQLKPRKYGAHVDVTSNGKDMAIPILGIMDTNIEQSNTLNGIESGDSDDL